MGKKPSVQLILRKYLFSVLGYFTLFLQKKFSLNSRKRKEEMTEEKRKGFIVKHNFNNDFVELWEELKAKYGEKVFAINGLDDKSLDVTTFPKNFYRKSASVASVSVDANANVSAKDISQYDYERFKAIQKLNSVYLMYKWVKKLFSKKDARKMVEKLINGEIFINDLVNVEKSYCFAFDLNNLLAEGMSFFGGSNMTINPPKRAESFIAQVIQTTAFISNQIMGAVAYPTFFPILDKFYRAEYGEDYVTRLREDNKMSQTIKNQFQNLIFSFNFPFRGNQSSFTNLSVLDRGFVEHLLSGYQFADDGTSPNVDSFIELSKVFFEYFVDIQNKEGVFTFPVMTLSLSLDENGNYLDEDMVKWIAKVNCEKSVGNIFQSLPTAYSSCFDGSQMVLTKSSEGIRLCPIKDIIEGTHKDYRTNLTVFHNGSWVHAKAVKLPKEGHKMFKVITANKKEMILTDNHLNLTMRGDISTGKLTTDDYIAFNARSLDTYPEADRKLTYEQGIFIGAYLGDGSKHKHKDCESYQTTFSLSEGKLHLLDKFAKALKDWDIKANITVHDGQHSVKFVNICSKDVFNTINEYVVGNYAPEKGLNPIVFSQSREFRRGILDGLYATDGGNCLRIYSTSTRLIQDMEALCTTLGINTCVNVDTRRDAEIRGEKINKNYDVLCLRWYDPKNKRGMGEDFKVINNTEYFKVKSIEEVETTDDYVYCFEMKNQDEPYFTLPNGIITHNCCRLKNDITKLNVLGESNSFGIGVSVGSHRVAGINLPRLAMLEKVNPNQLDETMDIIHKTLYAHRKLIEERINEGILPLYTTGWMDIKKQYSTVGLIGGYEYVKNKGLDILTEEGSNALLSVMKRVEEKIMQYQEAEKAEQYSYNIESIPGESMAVRLCNLDKLLGYCDKKVKLYSNQYVSLMDKCSLYDRMRVQAKFDKVTSGGSIMHCTYKDAKPLSPAQYEKVIRMAKDLGNEYFAINYAYCLCEKGHRTVGDHNECPICGKPITTKFQRVVGFITACQNWTPVRRDYEYEHRTSQDIQAEFPEETCV